MNHRICIKPNSNDLNIYKQKFLSTTKIISRGPDFKDSINFKTKKSECYLGFNRLAIIDLNSNANKIFYNDQYAFLFNGEIYNIENLKNI